MKTLAQRLDQYVALEKSQVECETLKEEEKRARRVEAIWKVIEKELESDRKRLIEGVTIYIRGYNEIAEYRYHKDASYTRLNVSDPNPNTGNIVISQDMMVSVMRHANEEGIKTKMVGGDDVFKNEYMIAFIYEYDGTVMPDLKENTLIE